MEVLTGRALPKRENYVFADISQMTSVDDWFLLNEEPYYSRSEQAKYAGMSNVEG